MAINFPTNTYLGTDLSCQTDLSTIDILVSGNAMLSQRLIRRLTTAPGAMTIIDPDGNSSLSLDLRQFINSPFSAQNAAIMQTEIQNICLQDQEVLSCTVQVIGPTVQNRVVIINVSIQTQSGPFTLTVSVDQLNANILYEITS